MLRAVENGAMVPAPDELALRFLDEAIAAVGGHGESPDGFDALRRFFDSLRPYVAPEDFDCGELPVPESLQRLTSGIELHFYFRARLRKWWIDPDDLAAAGERAA